jgi:hypothetical protein
MLIPIPPAAIGMEMASNDCWSSFNENFLSEYTAAPAIARAAKLASLLMNENRLEKFSDETANDRKGNRMGEWIVCGLPTANTVNKKKRHKINLRTTNDYYRKLTRHRAESM